MTRQEAVEWQNKLFPNEKWPRAPGPCLTQICMDLRSACNGSADPWSIERIREVREMLSARINTWATPSDTMDELVKSMVSEAIHIADGEIASWEEDERKTR